MQGTFDLSLARNTLRRKIAEQHWPIIFNARAATVLTALSELILALDQTQLVMIEIETIEDMERHGVSLSSQFADPDNKPTQLKELIGNLQRTTADSEIHESGNQIQIRVYSWVE